MDELKVIGCSKLDDSYSLPFFFYGLLRAEEAAASTSVTELGEYQDIVFKDCNSVVGTNFSTFTAIGAFFFYDLRDGNKNRLALKNARL
jgi:hypothetical protein